MEGLADDPPVSVAPYTVLEIDTGASPSEVRTAYKKLALRYHPDKASPSAQATAHTKFQEIAFAYAILSDPVRRARYDATGSTAESLAGVDGDFNWTDFFRQQYADAITLDRFTLMKSEYQNSAEETRDLLAAYKKKKGNMNGIFNVVMMSDVLSDEDRFRVIIDEAIARGEVESYDAYVNETAKSRELRRKRAERERKEAEKEAEKRGIYPKSAGEDQAKKRGQKRKAEPDTQELEALLRTQSKARASNFLEHLEAKYASKAKSGKSKKTKKHEEPPEEAFQKVAARITKRKTQRKKRTPTPPVEEGSGHDDEDEAEEGTVDLDAESPAEEDDDDHDDDQGGTEPEPEEEEEEEEEEEPVPKKRRRMPPRKNTATATATATRKHNKRATKKR